MKKGLIILGVIVVLAIIIASSAIGSYNGLVTSRENVNKAYSAIDVQLTRRADLIPNLVNTVKGLTEHEQEIVNSVTAARAKIGGGDTAERFQAENDLRVAIRNFYAVVENYPDIKSDQSFLQLSDQLEGTENRIGVARLDYNEAVNTYNSKVISFPGSILAGMFGFEKAAYFDAPEYANAVPQVDFSK